MFCRFFCVWRDVFFVGEKGKDESLTTVRLSGFLNCGGSAETRTLDRRIKSPLLYQLSYAPDRLIVGGSCEIRTHDQRIKSPLLYRLS